MKTPWGKQEWVVATTPPLTARNVLAYYRDGKTIHLMHYAYGQWWKDVGHAQGTHWPPPDAWLELPPVPLDL